MTEWPRVGLVVVGHNGRDLVRTCIGSLARLDYTNLHLIYVDNLSNDGTLEMLQQEFPHVDAVSSGANGGYCGGNNFGIRRALDAGCEYVMLLNPDTELHASNFLRVLVEFMEQHPEVGKCGPRVFMRQLENVQNTVIPFPFIHRRIESWLKSRLLGARRRLCAEATAPVRCDALNGCCVLVRAAALRQAGGLDEIMWCYADEVEWDWRLHAAGWDRYFVPVESVIHHQKLGGYDMTSRAYLMQSRNGAYFFRKHRFWLSMFAWILFKLLIAALRLMLAPLRRQSATEHTRFLRSLLTCLVLVSVGRYSSPAFGFGSDAAGKGKVPHQY